MDEPKKKRKRAKKTRRVIPRIAASLTSVKILNTRVSKFLRLIESTQRRYSIARLELIEL